MAEEGTSRPLVRLGQMVRARRLALDIREGKDLAQKVRVSPRVITDIERGNRKVGAATYSQLENVLNWETGSVEEILRGGKPVEVFDQYSVFGEPTGGSTRDRLLQQIADAEARLWTLEADVSAERARLDSLRHALSQIDAEGGDGDADAAGGSAPTSTTGSGPTQPDYSLGARNTGRRPRNVEDDEGLPPDPEGPEGGA